jgi:hypothetical protein
MTKAHKANKVKKGCNVPKGDRLRTLGCLQSDANLDLWIFNTLSIPKHQHIHAHFAKYLNPEP